MTTVLVVDDNPMDQRVAGACVEECGMSAIYAADGDEALGVLDGADIVLTDLDMPKIDGLQLVRRMQSRAPKLPVILMTAKGSEEIAAEALKAGASSYVAKRKLRSELQTALRIVLDAARARDRQENVYQYVVDSQTQFVIGNDAEAASSLVSHLQNSLILMDICSEAQLLAVGTALLEALMNAIDHGNLELDSQLLSENNGTDYVGIREQRMDTAPYKDRKVFVTSLMNNSEAVFTIRDEGPGFDVSTVPDPEDADQLMCEQGRGLLLIQMFMDEVSFNETGNEIVLRLYADDEES